MKVCDNVYLTKATYKFPASPVNSVTFILSALTLFLQQAHNTAVLYPAILCICFNFCPPSPRLCIIGTAEKKKKKKVLLREKSEPSLYTWHSAQETQSSSLKFKFQVALPPTRIITATGIQIVLCCTWTIHKGYYIVLHSFPFLQLSLVYVQVHFIFIFFSSTGVQNHF